MEPSNLEKEAINALATIIKTVWDFEVPISSKIVNDKLVLDIQPQKSSQAAVIIGLKGRNIESLRNLMRAWGAVRNVRVSIAPLIKK